MKIFLNLLPPDRKAGIVQRFYWRFFLWQWFFVALLALVALSIMFLFYVQTESLREHKERSGASKITANHREEYKKYEDRYSEANKMTQQAASFLVTHTSFSGLLSKIEATLPGGVRIDSLTTKDYKVTLKGTASKRDALLSFQDAVKKDTCFESVNTPLSNLFSETDVTFSVDFLVKPECLQGVYLK
jgi:Tfp pilus assembly protein PilN